MMNILNRLLGRKQKPLENTRTPTEKANEYLKFVDNRVKKIVPPDEVNIVVTDDFQRKQEAKGNFLPDEMEETVLSILPKKATDGSAGTDLRAYIDSDQGLDINPGETKLIKTGFKWIIPSGYVGMVCSRSGLALKNSVFVLNAPGIIDSDYRGDVGIVLHNAGQETFHISTGDRVAQMLIIKLADLPLVRVAPTDGENLSITETLRGADGFGSTGKG